MEGKRPFPYLATRRAETTPHGCGPRTRIRPSFTVPGKFSVGQRDQGTSVSHSPPCGVEMRSASGDSRRDSNGVESACVRKAYSGGFSGCVDASVRAILYGLRWFVYFQSRPDKQSDREADGRNG